MDAILTQLKGRGKTDLSPPSTSVSLGARSETTDGILELEAESEPDLSGILKSREERIGIIKELIECREKMIHRSMNTTKAQEKEFSKMRTRGVTEQEIESNPDFLCLAYENDYRTTQKAIIVALWEEQRELEESLPQLHEKILFNRAPTCPIRFYERQKRRDLQQLRAVLFYELLNLWKKGKSEPLRFRKKVKRQALKLSSNARWSSKSPLGIVPKIAHLAQYHHTYVHH